MVVRDLFSTFPALTEMEKYADDIGYELERHWMPKDFEKQGYLGRDGLTMKASPFFAMVLLRNQET